MLYCKIIGEADDIKCLASLKSYIDEQWQSEAETQLTSKKDQSLSVLYRGEGAFDRWLSENIAHIILHDVRSRYVKGWIKSITGSMTDEESSELQERAQKIFNTVEEDENALENSVLEHLKGNSELILSGFIRFKMRDIFRRWKNCVESLAQDVLLERETCDFVDLLRSIVDAQPPTCDTVNVVIRDDGLELCDELMCRLPRDAEFESAITGICQADAEDVILGRLIFLSPRRIRVICKADRVPHIAQLISSVFGKRMTLIDSEQYFH